MAQSMSLAQWHRDQRTIKRIWQPLHGRLAQIVPELASKNILEAAEYVAQLVQFQEDNLGRTRIINNVLRIPGKVFKDATPNGGLVHVVRAIYGFTKSQGLPRPDFSRQDFAIRLVQHIYDQLCKARIITPPLVYWAPSMPPARQKVFTDALRSLNGVGVQSTKEATHIVENWVEEPDESTYLRTLEKKDDMALVHYWYTPDSADAWMANPWDFEEPEPPPQHHGIWRVSARWLRDGALYNEWMNEEDYEVDEPAPVARTTTSSNTQQQKRQSSVNNADDSFDEDESQDEQSAVGDDNFIDQYADDDDDDDRGGGRGDDSDDGEEPPDADQDDFDYGSRRPPKSGAGSSKQSRAARPIRESNDDDYGTRRAGPSRPRPPKKNILALREKARTGPKPYPRMTFINMNERIWSQTKRWEWEPVADGLIRNISQCIYTNNAGSRGLFDLANAAGGEQGEVWDLLLEKAAQPVNKSQQKTTDDLTIPWPGTRKIVTPAMSQWFNISVIHNLEKSAFGDIFNPQPPPEPIYVDDVEIMPEEDPMMIRNTDENTYKMVRDYIIHTYRRRPIEYLPITECLGVDAKEDISLVYRLHTFLERWGLINYQAILHPSENREEATRGASLGSLVYKNVADLHDGAGQSSGPPPSSDKPPFIIPPHTTAVTSSKHFCMSCGATCFFILYASIEYAATEFCESCYLDGKYPYYMQSNRFVRIELPALYPEDDEFDDDDESQVVSTDSDDNDDDDSDVAVEPRRASLRSSSVVATTNPETRLGSSEPMMDVEPPTSSSPVKATKPSYNNSNKPVKQKHSRQWTDEEYYRLLAAVEKHGTDDWAAISVAMGGTKSKELCLKKFLRTTLDEEKVSFRHDTHPLDTSSYNEWEQEFRKCVPLLLGAGVENPLMNLLQTLSSATAPQVAAAASRGAMIKILQLRKQASNAPVVEQATPIEYSDESDLKLEVKDEVLDDDSTKSQITPVAAASSSTVYGIEPSMDLDDQSWMDLEFPPMHLEAKDVKVKAEPIVSTTAVPVDVKPIIDTTNNSSIDAKAEPTPDTQPNNTEDIAFFAKILPENSTKPTKQLLMAGALQQAMSEAMSEARILARYEQGNAQRMVDELCELQVLKIKHMASLLE
ncbi:hypothetical protein SmJEL517_g01718 [Synchytrium microbalum]|uniref:SWIRM domain-containing protein n=1 Tax=Synchytrium microbalum TaxID=1806994 RepID=A0A507C965_9FUNG|nr:uncharacterized protein SmJEL517_g01718 [Synchytrium microbalum]TPX36031.1 hypothetical protein SmJEL517_g01718 [Synchytrium microbalum]